MIFGTSFTQRIQHSLVKNKEFAKKCYEYFIQNNIKKILDLGCGQGRDTIFFTLNKLEVYVVDLSIVAIENIQEI